MFVSASDAAICLIKSVNASERAFVDADSHLFLCCSQQAIVYIRLFMKTPQLQEASCQYLTLYKLWRPHRTPVALLIGLFGVFLSDFMTIGRVPEGVMTLRPAKDEWSVTTGSPWSSPGHGWSTFSGMPLFLQLLNFLRWIFTTNTCRRLMHMNIE